jgi:peptidoglycan/xylan/chitin deacetylase (PgdA/CDA1 family)
MTNANMSEHATDDTRHRLTPARHELQVTRKRQIERLLSRAAGASAFRRWQGAVNAARGLRRARIVVYHSFTPGGWGCVEIADFRRHLDVFSRAYDVVGLPRLVRDLRAGAPTDRQVVLTIDDAYEDFFTHAYPILLERRMPATVFVPTAYIGSHNDWEESPAKRMRVMSRAQLRELDPTLITVGSHSVQHRELAGLGRDALESEVVRSKSDLEELLGREVNFFAFPFGYRSTYTRHAIDVLRRAGYQAAVSTRWGTYGSPGELFEMRRIDLHGARSTAEIESRLSGDWDWIAWRELLSHALKRRARDGHGADD